MYIGYNFNIFVRGTIKKAKPLETNIANFYFSFNLIYFKKINHEKENYYKGKYLC